jgi:sugar lactone lactonase YvrE
MTVTALTDTPLELGEGVRLVDGRLLLVDILAGTLYAHPGNTCAPLEKLLGLDVPLGAVAPVRGRRDTWIAAAGDGIALLTIGQPVQWLAHPERVTEGRTRMNDGACDPSGRFWAGSMAYDGTSSLGALYRVDTDARVERVLDDLVIVNGPAFSPDGTSMYVADSGRGTITRYDLDGDGWPVGATLLVNETSHAVPDGITIDRSGALWVAMWGGSELRRYSPDGDLLATVALPAAQPTSVALVGGRAVVTTARLGIADPGAMDGLVLSVALDGIDDLKDVTAQPTRAYG